MHIDPSGESFILIVAIVVLVAWISWDIYQISQGELNFNPENGDLNNSHKIQNPFTIYGYSLYMRYISNDKDFFEGSAGGIAAEWIWHNILYDGSYLLDKLNVKVFFGQDVEKVLGQSKTAGFGSTIFKDTVNDDSRGWVVYPSLIIERMILPVSLVYDLYKEYIER